MYCIKHDIMKDYLIKHRNEVRDVLLTEFNAKKQREMDRRDAREEGRIEGNAEGREAEIIEFVIKKVKRGQTLEQIADMLEKNPEKIEDIYHAVIGADPEYDLEKIQERVLRKL